MNNSYYINSFLVLVYFKVYSIIFYLSFSLFIFTSGKPSLFI